MPDTRRREHTRARLVAAAEEVFAAKGVRRVTVDDLVDAAGFTRGAFYSNFSSIEEVLFALFSELSEQMVAQVRSAVDETPEGEFTVGTALERLRPIGGRWYAVQAELTLLALRSEEARAVFREHRDHFEGEMDGLIRDVLGRLGRVPDVPVKQLTETAIALYLHALMQEAMGLDGLLVDQLVEVVLPRVILGLSRER